jgi:hypothetical protein
MISAAVPGVPHDVLTGMRNAVSPTKSALSVSVKAPTPREWHVDWPTDIFTHTSDRQVELYLAWPNWGSVPVEDPFPKWEASVSRRRPVAGQMSVQNTSTQNGSTMYQY